MAEIPLIPYILSAVLASLGFIIGYILLKIAPEEQKPLGKPLAIIRHAAFFGSVVVGLWTVILPLKAAIILFTCILFFLIKEDHFPRVRKLAILIFFGFLFASGSSYQTAFMLQFLCIFLYGLTTTIIDLTKKTNFLRISWPYLGFFASALAHFIIFFSSFEGTL